jgi:hypothetical protein
LGIARVVLIPRIVHRLTRARQSQRGNQLQLETLMLQKVRERTMIIAGRFETDQHRCSGSTQIIGQALEILSGVGQLESAADAPERVARSARRGNLWQRRSLPTLTPSG